MYIFMKFCKEEQIKEKRVYRRGYFGSVFLPVNSYSENFMLFKYHLGCESKVSPQKVQHQIATCIAVKLPRQQRGSQLTNRLFGMEIDIVDTALMSG